MNLKERFIETFEPAALLTLMAAWTVALVIALVSPAATVASHVI